MQLLLLFALLCKISSEDELRPFYLIAHMMQTIEMTNEALSDGANSIEVDVQFSREGMPLKMYHGFPCDCLRNCFASSDFVEYLNYVRDLGIPDSPTYNKNMTLLHLDLKLNSIADENLEIGGKNLAKQLTTHFYEEGKARTLVKIFMTMPGIKFEPFASSFIETVNANPQLIDKIGYEISGFDDLESIKTVLRRLKTPNVWLGQGFTNCFPQIDLKVRKAIESRDDDNEPLIKKVYSWSIQAEGRIRNDLRLNIDAITTNDVPTAFRIMREEEFAKKYRMATTADDPWKRIKGSQQCGRAPCHFVMSMLWFSYEFC